MNASMAILAVVALSLSGCSAEKQEERGAAAPQAIPVQVEEDIALEESREDVIARAIALVRGGKLDEAQAERDAMQPLMANESIWNLDGNDYPASQILAIANHLAQGELAQAKEDYSGAIAAYTSAVEVQDTLPYTEPPF